MCGVDRDPLGVAAGGASCHATRSPTANSVTPSPTATTVPAPSLPGTYGSGCL